MDKAKCFLSYGGKLFINFMVTLMLLNFGPEVTVANKDIPVCHKQWEKLGRDLAEWRERCLDDDDEIDLASCHEEKEYFRQRRLIHKQMCFYEGPFPEPYLLINSKKKIAVVDLALVYSTSVFSGQKMIKNLAIDPASGKMLFETKAKIWKIHRSNFDWSRNETVLQEEAKGMQTFSIDWVGRRTFWVYSNRRNEIYVGTIDFKFKISLLRIKGDTSSLAVDPNMGYLFCDNQRKMIRFSFSGGDKKELNTSLDGFHISLDYANKLVYLCWSRSQGSTIISMDYDGHHKKTIIQSAEMINAFVIFGDILYTQNVTSRVIHGVNVTTGILQYKISLPRQWTRLSTILVVDKSKYPTDGCPSSPCRANAYCNRIKNNSTCKCHVGFFWNGSSCTTEDGCPSSPCRANEYCNRINNKTTCRCDIGFFWNGSSCTNEGLSVLKFRGDDTTQYGISRGSPKILKAFTVCFWLSVPKRYVGKHEPTPFSYATKGRVWGNDILLTLKPTLEVVLNDNIFRTKVDVADGKPHYICVTWESLSGLLQVFKDGVCVKEMKNSIKGDSIKADGTWVIGQDQDFVGGGFQKIDSFQGTLTEVNVWNKVLCAHEISRVAKDCGWLVKGNYKTLSDFTLSGVEFLIPKFPCCPKVNASCSF